MIIRKPYAFLIKYFKVIHIGLCLLMFYLTFTIGNIYNFFKTYIVSGASPYIDSLLSYYMSPLMFIAVILLIVSLILIFFLMKDKKKPFLYYLVSTIFYILIFIALILYSSAFIYLQKETYSNQTLVLFRDFTMVIYFANYYFIVMAFIRGFGFNIKKFDFEKDLVTLDISDSDREEIEIGVSVDYDKVLNKVRYGKRNILYYVKEHSFALLILLGIFASIITIPFLLDKLVFDKTYGEGDTLVLNNIEYNILDSYVTNLDKDNNVINAKDKYVIVDFSVLNKNKKNKTLKINATRIKINNKYYYPISNVGSKFNDIGNVYKEQTLINNKEKDYIIVFQIPKNEYRKSMILELYYDSKVVNGNTVFSYKKIKLKPTEFKETDLGEFNLNNEVKVNLPFVLKKEFLVASYDINNIYDYKYTKCDNETVDGMCIDYNAILIADINKTLLEIEYSFLDTYKIFNYMTLEYTLNDKTYTSDIKNITPDSYLENKVVLEVDEQVKDANKIKLVFNNRGLSFDYNLLGGDTIE